MKKKIFIICSIFLLLTIISTLVIFSIKSKYKNSADDDFTDYVESTEKPISYIDSHPMDDRLLNNIIAYVNTNQDTILSYDFISNINSIDWTNYSYLDSVNNYVLYCLSDDVFYNVIFYFDEDYNITGMDAYIDEGDSPDSDTE